jgi:tRNA-uridine 2-sulfurtransferase
VNAFEVCDPLAYISPMTLCAIPKLATADMDEAINSVRDSVGLAQGSRIVAAMSGGVDSTVVAALLHMAGYEVIGVTLQLYDHGQALKKTGACCAGQDIHDARKASETIGIAHYVLDYESRFRDSVIEDFADSYLRGETPVPCIRCNQSVKFHDLLQISRDLGAQALATGHYVDRAMVGNQVQMRRALDKDRDQSYFLFATTKDQLDYLRFPLSSIPKPQVRDLALQLGLSIAHKPDSQDICFVPEGKYTTLIDRLRPQGRVAGDIVHIDGRILGQHKGITDYTIGQRRGLQVAIGEPLFVIKIEADKRQVIVGPREALLTKGLTLKDTNWLGQDDTLEAAAASGLKVLARVRSTRPPLPAKLISDAEGVKLLFDTPEEGVAPGQACVVYDAVDIDRVLGGGFIAATLAA